jgi:hypothetical protein
MGNKQSKNIEYLNTIGNLTVNTWQKRNQKHFNKNCAFNSPFFLTQPLEAWGVANLVGIYLFLITHKPQPILTISLA